MNNIPLHINKTNGPLASKASSILSTSYSDAEFRDALFLLEEQGIDNNPITRRQIRLDLVKEVVDCNGKIIDEFGKIAEVHPIHPKSNTMQTNGDVSATASCQGYSWKIECGI